MDINPHNLILHNNQDTSLRNNSIFRKNNTSFCILNLKVILKAFSYNKIISNEPNNPHAYYGLGKLFQLMNNRDNEAIQNYNKCVEIDPNYLKAKIQLGILFLKIKDYDNYYTEKEQLVDLREALNNVVKL